MNTVADWFQSADPRHLCVHEHARVVSIPLKFARTCHLAPWGWSWGPLPDDQPVAPHAHATDGARREGVLIVWSEVGADVPRADVAHDRVEAWHGHDVGDLSEADGAHVGVGDSAWLRGWFARGLWEGQLIGTNQRHGIDGTDGGA